MESIIYVDGQYLPQSQAKISVLDHGVLYGDGVFEGIRLYSRNLFRLKEHLDRLWDSAHAIILDIPGTREQMAEIVAETCRRNNLENGYIRLVVTRGIGELGLSPEKCNSPSVFCIASSIKLYPDEYYENGLEIITAATRRISPDAFSVRIKSLNYLNNVMAKINATNAGMLEALMLNAEGYVLEATGDNVFLVKGGRLLTVPTYMGALRGITRDAVVDLARDSGIPFAEQPITLYEVYTADEMFLTGTAAEVIPVSKVDGRPIGNGRPGEITKRLLQRFHEITTTDGYRI